MPKHSGLISFTALSNVGTYKLPRMAHQPSGRKDGGSWEGGREDLGVGTGLEEAGQRWGCWRVGWSVGPLDSPHLDGVSYVGMGGFHLWAWHCGKSSDLGGAIHQGLLFT